MIEITKYSELDSQTKNKLQDYINSEFGDIPIVKETQWATPNWTIILYKENEIATFYNIVERSVLIDGSKLKIAGINNVITPKKFRGNGYATKILQETNNLIFDDLKSDHGLLLCADDLVKFYSRLDWYKIECPVHFEQSHEKKLWKANTMLLTKKEQLNPKSVDLNGLPW